MMLLVKRKMTKSGNKIKIHFIFHMNLHVSKNYFMFFRKNLEINKLRLDKTKDRSTILTESLSEFDLPFEILRGY